MTDETITVEYDLGEVIAGTVDDIVAKLASMTAAELNELHEREEAGKNRATLLAAIHREIKVRAEQDGEDLPPAETDDPVYDGWSIDLLGEDEQPVALPPIAVDPDPAAIASDCKFMRQIEIGAHMPRMTIIAAVLRLNDAPRARADLVFPVTAGAGQAVTFAAGTFAFKPIA